MAQKVTVQLIDDLDGTVAPDIQTVEFSLDNATYEIDLTGDNAAQLREVLAEFIEAGRRTGGKTRRAVQRTTSAQPRRFTAVAGSGRSAEQLANIREWARSHGYDVAARGRISVKVVEAYDEAHKPQPPAAGPATRNGGGRKGPRPTTKAARSTAHGPGFSG